MKVFAERLKELREERGLSRAELGKETGFAEMSIGRWENAKQIPNIEVLSVLAKFFKCSANYLVGMED